MVCACCLVRAPTGRRGYTGTGRVYRALACSRCIDYVTARMSGTTMVGWMGAPDTLEETRALASDGRIKSKEDAEGTEGMAAHGHALSRWRWLFILGAGGATLLCWALVVYWLGAVTLGAKGADPTARGFSWVTGDKRVFNWHPVLMTGGFVAALRC